MSSDVFGVSSCVEDGIGAGCFAGPVMGHIDGSMKSREKQQLMTFEVKETGLLHVAGPLLCPLMSQPAGQTCRQAQVTVCLKNKI